MQSQVADAPNNAVDVKSAASVTLTITGQPDATAAPFFTIADGPQPSTTVRPILPQSALWPASLAHAGPGVSDPL